MEVMMNNTLQRVMPHGRFLEMLFAHFGRVSQVFQDVKGLYDIHHLAVTYVDHHHLLTFSSTPSLEFNLFGSQLWLFDKTYHPKWYQSGAMTSWESLYIKAQYEELFYLKQLKHHLPLGMSFSMPSTTGHLIYSLGSHGGDKKTQEIYKHQKQHLVRIAEHCGHRLLPLFYEVLGDSPSQDDLQKQNSLV